LVILWEWIVICFWNGADTSQQTEFQSVSEEEWKKRLTQQQFYVARKKGTERAFTGYAPSQITKNSMSSSRYYTGEFPLAAYAAE
jgi:hypothetical protein